MLMDRLPTANAGFRERPANCIGVAPGIAAAAAADDDDDDDDGWLW